jgi:hypothetical protein
MKRGTPEHPKTRALARKLKIQIPHAVGLLEMLWHWTARFAIQGDIGKWSNSEIAEQAGWHKNADEFIAALVDVKLLDRCEIHRLVIHDWHEHADQSVKKTLVKRGLPFLTVSKKVQNNSGTIPEPFRNDDGTIPDEDRTIPSSRAVAGSGSGSGTGTGTGSGGKEEKTSLPAVPDADLFRQWFGVFIACGLDLNETDQYRCLGIFAELTPEEQRWCVEDCQQKALKRWRSKDLTKDPWNYLHEQPWTRRSIGRVLPDAAKPESRADAAQRKAAEAFRSAGA